jgi:hypothetical protein
MDKLKLIQTYNNLKIRAAERPLPLSTVEKDNVRQMRNIQTQYQNSEISRQEFVKLIKINFIKLFHVLKLLKSSQALI